MSTASAALRTYGKRQGNKRKQPLATPGPGDKDSTPSLSPSKRRRVSGEIAVRTPSPVETDEGADTEVEEVTPIKSKSLKMYGAARAHLPATSKISEPKPVRDLSVIFNAITPSSTPTKLAKRMLGRSKTDSSVELSPRLHQVMDRTSSLPNLPSSSQSSMNPSPALTRSSTPLTLPISSKPATKTYAGKYRSFLVALPPASSTSLAPGLEAEDESRESYSSLRNRWGVDNSEDDPHPFEMISPTKTVSSVESSPSKNGKGKSKSVALNRTLSFQSGMVNPLKSISELRNKGESRRFLDEVGYLFEGLDPKCAIGLRRASALEINTKLCDLDFTRKAKAADLYSRTWDLFIEAGAGKGDDEVFDILLIFFLALVARDPSSLAELAERSSAPRSPSPSTSQNDEDEEYPSVVAVLSRILGTATPDADLLNIVSKSCQDGIQSNMAGVSRKDGAILISIHKVVSTRSNLFPASSLISKPLMISYILQSLPHSSLSALHLPTVLTSLRNSLSPSTSSTLHLTLPLKWLEVVDSLPYEGILYHLRLVETYLLGQWGISSDEPSQSQDQVQIVQELPKARDDWMAEDLISLCVCCELKIREDNSRDLDFSVVQKCFDLAFRVLVSLTHKDDQWGRKVLHCEFTMGVILRTIHRTGNELHDLNQRTTDASCKRDPTGEDGSDDHGAGDERKDKDPGSYALDTLCLSLGLLTNLVQIVDEAKNAVRLTRLNPSCTLNKRSCVTQCTCPQPSTGLDILISLYDQQTQTTWNDTEVERHVTEREAEASFLRGHLAVLFGLLMMHCPDNQAAILGGLKLPASFYIESRLDSRHRNRKAGTRFRNGNEDNTKRAKLAKLVNQAKDFVLFYTAVSRRLSRGTSDVFGGGEETGDGKDDKTVAKDVLRFLEDLHDSVP